MPEVASPPRLPFWRMEPPELGPVLDRRGNQIHGPDGKPLTKVTRGGFLPHQQAWWDLPNFIKALVAGYGAGKTNVVCKRAISVSLVNAPAPTAMVSPTYRMARDTIVETLERQLAGKATLLEDFEWRYWKGANVFTFRHGKRANHIKVYSGEDPSKLRGPNLGAAYIDEPFLQEQAVFDQMIARVRHPAAQQKEIGLTGTPESLNWGYDLCAGELSERHDVGYVQASTYDNYVVGEEYAKRLEGSFADRAADAYIHGAFVNLAKGMVYYGFKALKGPGCNVHEYGIPDGAELFAGMDFNVNPMAFLVGWHHEESGHMHVMAEYELPNADTEYACAILREHWVDEGPERRVPAPKPGQRGWTLREVFPDPTGRSRSSKAPGGKTDFFYIQQAGFEVRSHTEPGKPAQRDAENAVNGKFAPRAGSPTLTIDPRCKKLIKYLSVYSHELKHKAEQKAMSHLLDALKYPCEFLYPVSRERVLEMRLTGY